MARSWILVAPTISRIGFSPETGGETGYVVGPVAEMIVVALLV